MKVREIIQNIESVAPLSLQEHWDNSGIQIGDVEQEVHSVLLCTDITEDILREAIERKCQLVISHHPLLFHGLKTIQGNTNAERCAILAIKNNISLYSSHTAMDVCLHGVSGHIADRLGMKEYEILSTTQPGYGLGVIGCLPTPVRFLDFLNQIADSFHVQAMRYTQPKREMIERIAICGGAGSEFVALAIAQEADVYLSSDFKYHEFCEANGQIAIVDMGHFESEQYTKEVFADLLDSCRNRIEIVLSESDRSPVLTYIRSNNKMN